MLDWLLEPLSFGFIRTALLASTLVGLTCACVGVYVVLRRMAFIGDALAHTALPGVVVAYLNGWNMFAGAVVAGMVTAFGIGWFSRRQSIREDTAIGVLFTGMFALGILLISTVRSFRDFTHILFGDILGVTPEDLALMAGVAGVTLLVLLFFHKELELSSYDPQHAEVIGIQPDRMRMLLLMLLALTVVTSIQVVGVVLTSALLVTPAAAASLLTKRLPQMMLIAALIAVGAGFVGLYASYYATVSSGAAIVLTCTACFGAAWAASAIRSRAGEGRDSVTARRRDDLA
jgi:manganese/iron transport system permease protein